jgi:nicotinate-nucleotide--dimethylbenzimidazole phosphoribosyltransferase
MTVGEGFEAACASIGTVSAEAAAAGAHHHDNLTKPRGSLGRLEELGIRLCAVYRTCPPPVPEPVTVVVFAADHGVVAEGVTPWPQEVTAQMVANFGAGGAAINVLARHAGATVVVVDVGVASPIPAPEGAYRKRTVASGTRNLAVEAAMTPAEARAALDVGVASAAEAVDGGARLLVTGDMGIGNTTAAAAVIAGCTGRAAAEVTGRGTGIDDTALQRKISIIDGAVTRIAPVAGPLDILTEVGGLEIAALCGFVVGAASRRVPVVVDGVIAAAAALLAITFNPDVVGYVIAGHRSSEPGSGIVLERLGLSPVLDLDMRLGEGSGAALAVPVVQAAALIMREMATFDAAGVTDKGDPRD